MLHLPLPTTPPHHTTFDSSGGGGDVEMVKIKKANIRLWGPIYSTT